MSLPALINAQQLHAALNESNHILVVDLSSTDNYNAGHIEGAVHVLPSQLSSGIAPATGSLPSLEQLTALLSVIGFDGTQHVVALDDAGGSWAGRFIWTLTLLGFSHSSLLDGGRNAWLQTGLPVTSTTTLITPAKPLTLSINSDYVADKNEIAAKLGTPDFVIWDARSPEEYAGSKVLAARGGHIPGAINIEWTQLMDNEQRLLPLDVIAKLLDNAGISQNKTVVTHCQTHRRSGLTWFVAHKLLHYPAIKAYPGSWSEWGNDANTPIEN